MTCLQANRLGLEEEVGGSQSVFKKKCKDAQKKCVLQIRREGARTAKRTCRTPEHSESTTREKASAPVAINILEIQCSWMLSVTWCGASERQCLDT